MAKNKLYWETEEKRGEKEGKKREKEKRIKEDRRKKRIKRERKGKKRKEGGKGRAKQSEIKKNMGEYLLILYTLSPLTSPGTCPSRWTSGVGPVVLIFRC